jgi:sortase B
MKKIWYRILCILLAGVLVVSCFFLVRQLSGYRAAKTIYDEAKNLAGMAEIDIENVAVSDQTAAETILPPQGETAPKEGASDSDAEEPDTLPESLSFLNQVDLSALQEVNGDVIGWIYLPDSAISYPILASQDNNEYLTQAWDGTSNAGGSIFLDERNESDLSDANVILYGHRMRDGSMFAALKNYRTADYWSTHPTVYLVTAEEIRAYDIFAAYEADVEGDTYWVTFPTEEIRIQAVEGYLSQSLVQQGTLDENASVLTLSTCNGRGTYETRWVVQASETHVWLRSK